MITHTKNINPPSPQLISSIQDEWNHFQIQNKFHLPKYLTDPFLLGSPCSVLETYYLLHWQSDYFGEQVHKNMNGTITHKDITYKIKFHNDDMETACKANNLALSFRRLKGCPNAWVIVKALD